MELVHLRTFLAVLEHRGFRSAARHLYLSQPAVSRQVAALEREVGVPLLVRDGAGVEPTAAGLALAEWGQVLLDDHAAALRAARALELSGTLTVAITPGGFGELTTPLLRHLARALPRVTFRRQDFTLLDWPRVGPPDVDLLLGRDPLPLDMSRTTVVLSEPMRLAVPGSLPESDADSLSLDEVAQLPFARLSPKVQDPVVHFWTLRSFLNDTELRFSGRASTGPASVGTAIDRGDGVAFATRMIVRQFTGPTRARLIGVPGAPRARLAVASAIEDRRPVIDAVHREVAWATRRLGPLVLPELAEARPFGARL